MLGANGRLSIDKDGHLNSTGLIPVSQYLGALDTQLKLFLSQLDACDRDTQGNYLLHGPGLKDTWEIVTSLALAVTTTSIPCLTSDEETKFKEQGIVVRQITPPTNLRPLNGLMLQIVFSILWRPDGQWAEMVSGDTVRKIRAYAAQVEIHRDMWLRHEAILDDEARSSFMIERRNLGSAKQFADQFRVIADRFNAVGTVGTLHERSREHHVQMRQAGWLVIVAIERGWLSVPESYKRWALEETKREVDAAATRDPRCPHMDWFIKFFWLFVDQQLQHAGGLVRPEPGGLSSMRLPGDADQNAAILAGRLQTASDACRWIATHLEDEEASPPNGDGRAAACRLRDEHLTILAQLASKTTPMTASSLATLSGMPCYDTLLDMLKELEAARLVSRPFGKNSGYVIEERGRAELKQRDMLP